MKSKIDWDNRIIIGKSGKVYKITPETLSAGRAAEFEVRSILLPYRINFETLYKLNNETIQAIKDIEIGKIKVGVLMDIVDKYEKLQAGLYSFQLNKRSAIVEFCGLFCIAEGEEVGSYNEDIIREKFEDWKDIPESDFFLLCGLSIPYFRESLIEIKESNLQEKQTAAYPQKA